MPIATATRSDALRNRAKLVAAARQLFAKLLPMINLEETYGMPFAKAVLVRRGVFKTAKMRGRSEAELDKVDEQELEGWWKQLQPYFRA